MKRSTAITLMLTAVVGSTTAAFGQNATITLPETKALTAVIRDVRDASMSGGHPDFETFGGSRITVNLLERELDAEGKPVVRDVEGDYVDTDYTDSQGRPIMPSLYDASRGDREGSMTSGRRMFTSEDSFYSWYHDVPGVNAATTVELVFHRVPGTDRYVFDSNTQEPWASIGRGGFFPINDELFGNFMYGLNYHFTTELTSKFTYDASAEQVFHFTGDDDVWVFIDGKLAVDLGGLHPKREQYLDLSRLDWLVDGEDYDLKLFHAERHTGHSNFRIETNLALKRAEMPTSAAMFD
jgi:fibro-slime domain-containing protein